ncbi:MAG: porin [Candidatus Thiodiazotropha sp.]
MRFVYKNDFFKVPKTDLTLAAALVAPVAALADATVYGKAHMVVQNASEDDGTEDVDVWSADSIDSRVGVKGKEDLDGGLKAVCQFEFKVNLDDGDALGDRNRFGGLAGGFGTVPLGRHDTPFKMSQGKFDQFGDVAGDIKSVIPGEDRVGNVIAYVSPSMGGLSIVGALVPVGRVTAPVASWTVVPTTSPLPASTRTVLSSRLWITTPMTWVWLRVPLCCAAP